MTVWGIQMSNQSVAYFALFIKNSKELTFREKEILLYRLRKKTLKKLGRKYRLSGERIRQIEKQAINKFFKKTNQLPLFN